jgi:hypothetical protein
VNKFLHCQNMDTHYSAGVGEWFQKSIKQ